MMLLPLMTWISAQLLLKFLDARRARRAARTNLTVRIPEIVIAKIASSCTLKQVVLLSRSNKSLHKNMELYISVLRDHSAPKIQHFARFRCKKFSMKRLVEWFVELTSLSEIDMATTRWSLPLLSRNISRETNYCYKC